MELLDKVGLKERATHRPNELSGGERQRVAVARALSNNPSLILADEPTGNLDSKTGKDVLELFEKLHSEGITILMVTHDTEVAERSQRIINILDGKIA